jgi:F-type H+-transporting ATPase subunit b
MSDSTNITATLEVPAAAAHEEGGASSLIQVSGPLMLLTWATFLAVSFVLYKVAWRPILRALDQREQSIRQSLDAAAKARADLAAMETRSRQAMADAERQREEIVSAARLSAAEIAGALESQARQKVQTMTEEARREIAAATEKARAALRAETADMAIDLAGRVIGENMDTGRNRTLVEKLAKEV